MASDGTKRGPATDAHGAHVPPASASSSTLIAEQEASMVGEVIDGRYRVISKLGEGGMGEVYAAEHVHIEKRVAVKLLRPEIVSNKEAVSRFRQEARSASSIGHKNIIAIEDFGTLPDGRIYLCMELLAGAPLNDLIKEPMSMERLLNILIQTGHGLAAAHAKGIVHRDMKPENIFVTVASGGEETPKLLDFGIAKVAGNDGQNNLTRTGTIFGTPFYMAPEQALGQTVDARADIYAMGVIMYEVFSGSLPFQGDSFMGILTQHITTEPEPVAQRAARAGRALPPGLADVIARCMQKDPERRYRTMDELVQELVQVYRNAAGSGMSSYMDAYVPPPTGMLPAAGSGMGHGPTGRAPTGGNQEASGLHPAGAPPYYGAPAHPGHGPHGSSPQPYQTPPPHGAPQHGSAGYTPAPYTPQPYTPGTSGMSSVDMPKKGGKVALIFALIAVLAVGGAVAAFLIVEKDEPPGTDGSGSAGEQPIAVTVDATPVAAATPDAAPVAAAPPDAAPVTPPDVKAEPVVVLVNASTTADVYENGKKLGRSPQIVRVVPGETRSLVLKARGYKDAAVEIDGTREEVAVRMDRINGTIGKDPGTKDPKDPKDPKPPATKPTTSEEKLRELCRKNPNDRSCLLLDD
jgi:serine/threonine protein kinase